MPHVVTQWESAQVMSEALDRKSSPTSPRRTNEIRRSAPPSQRRRNSNLRSPPSISLLATPELNRWDFGSIRHLRQCSSTPPTATDSAFEILPPQGASPPTSPLSSPFIAELEDTSIPFPVTVPEPLDIPDRSKPPRTVDNSALCFKSSKTTSRAAIKVVDETIAAIEASNRELLDRAIAAEEAAHTLREQNNHLQLQISQCNERNRRDRPKTAPALPRLNPPPSRPYRHKAHASVGYPNLRIHTPLSQFNEQMDKLEVQGLKQDAHKSAPLEAPLASPRDIAPRRLCDRALLPSPLLISPRSAPLNPQTHDSLPTARPLHHAASHSKISAISTPLPGSVTRHQVLYAGAPLSHRPHVRTISLEEARRRAKPLPPLGPISPRVVHGRVEVGLSIDEGAGEWDPRFRRSVSGAAEKETMIGRARAFSDRFRRRKSD